MKKDLLKRSLEVLDSHNAEEFVTGMDLIADSKEEALAKWNRRANES